MPRACSPTSAPRSSRSNRPAAIPTRCFPPLLDGGSGWFAYLNYGKKSVTSDKVDLDALLRGADVLINSTGGDHGAHPHLVAVDLSWFGRSGPYRDFKASDAVCRALAGFVQLIGPQEGPPLTLPDYQSAIMGGLAAFIPAMAALLGRQSRRYEVSVHEATIALAEYQAIEAWATGTPQKRWGFNRFTPTYPMGVYRCKQGWIGITIVTPAQWKSFCDLLGMPDLGRHPQHVMGNGAAGPCRRAGGALRAALPRPHGRGMVRRSGSSCACPSPSCPT